jgi:hypothetical protein
VPVLARTYEKAGMPTITVTNMPFWAERLGAPRTLAVEMPFGHILGRPGDAAGQMRIIRQALEVLESAAAPDTIVHSEERWPGSEEEAETAAHPPIPPPITAEMGRHIGSFIRALRQRGG